MLKYESLIVHIIKHYNYVVIIITAYVICIYIRNRRDNVLLYYIFLFQPKFYCLFLSYQIKWTSSQFSIDSVVQSLEFHTYMQQQFSKFNMYLFNLFETIYSYSQTSDPYIKIDATMQSKRCNLVLMSNSFEKCNKLSMPGMTGILQQESYFQYNEIRYPDQINNQPAQ